MYCKTCGAENSNASNYCKNDGVSFNNAVVTYRTSDQRATFCSNCGSRENGGHNYCNNCGKELLVYTRSKKALTKIVTPLEPVLKVNVPQKLSAFKIEYLKRSLIPALVSLVLLFVISFIMVTQSKEFNSTDKLLENAVEQLNIPYGMYGYIDELTDPDRVAQFEEEMESYLDEDVDLSFSKIPDKFFNYTDFALLANLQNPKLSVDMDMKFEGEQQQFNGELEIKNGFLILILIPFIVLFIGGVVSGRMNKTAEPGVQMYHAFSLGLLYALGLTIISLIPGFSYEVDLKGGINNFSLDISRSYSLFTTFAVTFVIGFVFSGLGVLFATCYRKTTGHLSEWLPNGEAIHQAFSTIVRGFIIMFVTLLIIISNKVAEFGSNLSMLFDLPETIFEKSFPLIATVSAQLGSYIWNLSHLAPLKLIFDSSKDGDGIVSYQLFSGLKGEDNGAGLDPIYFLKEALAFTDIETYLKWAVILPILLFLWSGYRMGIKHGQSIINTLIYSVVYSFIMLYVSVVSDLGFSYGFTIKGDENDFEQIMLSLGFSPFLVFVTSLLFSFIFALCGTYLYKFKKARM